MDTPPPSAPEQTEVEGINFLPAGFKAEGDIKDTEEIGVTEHSEDLGNGDPGVEQIMQEAPVNHPLKIIYIHNMEIFQLLVINGGPKTYFF